MGRSLLVVGSLLLLFVGGCGRPRTPRPPEDYSPRAVDQVSLEAADDAITLSWNGPTDDQRGKELKSMEGYRVFRQILTEREEKPRRFELLGFVSDPRIEMREQKKAELRAQGKSGRRVKLSADTPRFTFKDSNLSTGTRYAYKIVPVNQSGVEGEITQWIEVLFRGKESQSAVIAQPSDVVDAAELTASPTYGE